MSKSPVVKVLLGLFFDGFSVFFIEGGAFLLALLGFVPIFLPLPPPLSFIVPFFLVLRGALFWFGRQGDGFFGWSGLRLWGGLGF